MYVIFINAVTDMLCNVIVPMTIPAQGISADGWVLGPPQASLQHHSWYDSYYSGA